MPVEKTTVLDVKSLTFSYGNWPVIEDFCRTVSGRDDVWYAGILEICRYTRAFEALEYSVDCRIIRNPSALTVWILAGDEIRMIAGGATINL